MTEQHDTPEPQPRVRALLTAAESAKRVRLSKGAFWNGVRNGAFPAPVYPAPRAPRWFDDELLDALERTRALPSEALMRRQSRRTSLSALAVA